MTKQAVLLYNCSGPQWTKLHQMMMMLRFRIRMIRPEQYHLPLEQLAQGQGEPAADNVPETFPESMMVFCGVGQAQLEAILNAVRLSKLPPIPLKAVLTDSNREWDSVQLHEELLKEKETIAQQSEAKKAGAAEK